MCIIKWIKEIKHVYNVHMQKCTQIYYRQVKNRILTIPLVVHKKAAKGKQE